MLLTSLNAIAVLDANVLYPVPIRDLLLSLAKKDYFNLSGHLLFKKSGFGIYY